MRIQSFKSTLIVALLLSFICLPLATQAATTSSFIAISDMHVKSTNTQPTNYGQDTSMKLWQSVKDELTILIGQHKPNFVILLGDLPAHTPVNRDKNIATVLTDLSGLPAISTNNLPVFYVYGNNDSLAGDYGAFNNGTKNLFSLDPNHASAATKGWPALNANPDCSASPSNACTYTTTSPMPPQHATDMANAEQNGYYSAYPLGNASPLRLIVINSVIFSRSYKGPAQLATAQAEMDWLADQLAAAKKNGESVYIAMHIPVGKDAYSQLRDMWNATLILKDGKIFRDEFISLITQYKSTVNILMTGHTHLNELRVINGNSKSNSISGLDVGVPAISPIHNNNPGMQVMFYDNAYKLTEIMTYYTMPNTNSWMSYSFNTNYNCANNSTIITCVTNTILPQLPTWKMTTTNPYTLAYPVQSTAFSPTQAGSGGWQTIMDAIQVN